MINNTSKLAKTNVLTELRGVTIKDKNDNS